MVKANDIVVIVLAALQQSKSDMVPFLQNRNWQLRLGKNKKVAFSATFLPDSKGFFRKIDWSPPILGYFVNFGDPDSNLT